MVSESLFVFSVIITPFQHGAVVPHRKIDAHDVLVLHHFLFRALSICTSWSSALWVCLDCKACWVVWQQNGLGTVFSRDTFTHCASGCCLWHGMREGVLFSLLHPFFRSIITITSTIRIRALLMFTILEGTFSLSSLFSSSGKQPCLLVFVRDSLAWATNRVSEDRSGDVTS